MRNLHVILTLHTLININRNLMRKWMCYSMHFLFPLSLTTYHFMWTLTTPRRAKAKFIGSVKDTHAIAASTRDAMIIKSHSIECNLSDIIYLNHPPEFTSLK